MPQWTEGLRKTWRRIRPRSIRARVTLGAMSVLVVFFALGMLTSILLVRELLETQERDRAAEAARIVVDHITAERVDGSIPATDQVLRLQVVDREGGAVLAASDAVAGLPALAQEDPATPDFRVDTTVCGSGTGAGPASCLLVVGYSVDDTAYGDVLVLAATRPPSLLTTSTPEAVLVGMAVAVLGATGLVIWYGVGRALRPVALISAELDRLSASDLYHRLPVPASEDEIARLARTANTSLERLSDAVTRQRRFVSDASHELRNPIAGMRTKLEVELSDPEPDTRSRELLLTSLLSDTERLENIVTDLLVLARLDTRVSQERERVDLSALVAKEFSDRRHPEIRMHSSGPVWVLVNRLRLVRLLTNLIANAERHADSRIDVIVGRDGDMAVVEVHDDGAGIAEQDRERVFERFSRLRESKERDPGGSGLGLPISREIAQTYGGSLTAGQSDLLGGALFTVRLPAQPDRPR